MKRFILILLLLFPALSTSAQDYIDLGELGYRYSFRTDAPEGGEQGTVVEGARFNILLPLKVSENSFLLPGTRFWQFNLNPGTNLKLYFFQLGFQTKLTERTSWQFIPMFRSGMYENASFGDGFQYGVLTSIQKKVSDKLMLGYGLYANNELFGPLLTPFMAIDWQITERWRLFGNFPMYNTLSYSINPRMNTGLHYIGLVTSFSGDGTYIERQSVDISWFYEYYLTGKIVARIHAGYPVGRTFEEFAENDKMDFSLSLIRFGEDRQPLSTFDESNVFVNFGLYFRVKK